MTRELSKFYVPFDTLDVRAFDGLSKFMADGTIGYGVHKFVHHVSKLNNAYYYKFSFIGRYSQFLYPRNHPYGVHHSDDIQYVFVASFIGASPIKFLDPENVAVERMTRIWEQFAKTGYEKRENFEIEVLTDLCVLGIPIITLTRFFKTCTGRNMMQLKNSIWIWELI